MSRALRPVAVVGVFSLALSACGGAGGGGYGGGNGGGYNNPPVQSTPTTTNESAFVCPTSDTTFSRASASAEVRRAVSVRHATGAPSSTMLIVSYATKGATATALSSRINALGVASAGDVQFANVGRAAKAVRVNATNAASVASALRGVAGVTDVSPMRRLASTTVSAPYFTNDPYFDGLAGAPAPLYQTASTGGQWDMHIIGLDHAFAYSQSNNGSGVTNAGALGSTSVKLAIVDTGEDLTHPDLSGATVARTHCFLTDDNNNLSTGTFVTDPVGHGTDVTGIAAAVSNNHYGFTGAGGNVSLMLYRVFPTPDDNCTSSNASLEQNDPQCGAADLDIASAINDAVANGANVINLSLGGAPCANGTDPDTLEGNAIANAIAAHVIVVASSGNDSAKSVAAPACDSGVIAVGASSYNDGTPNGSGYTGANAEYVASYADVGTPDVLRSASSWGIVAPGGDPVANDADSLHWIENIWTSTPYQSSPSDLNFAGACNTDPFGETGDCRILIAGTSMASPHVAGAAALVLSVNASYASPAAMKQLLCSTADDLGDPNQGCGRLNIYRAIATAVGDPNLP